MWFEPQPVHPTFLYELLWNLLIFGVLIWADRRFKLGHGRLFALYVAGYCLGRFWIELMRSDWANEIAGIRVNSFTSTFVFIGAVIYVMVAPKGREDPATVRGKHFEESDGDKVDSLIEDLVAVEATSGIVAAAKAAGAEDESAPGGDTESPDDESSAEAVEAEPEPESEPDDAEAVEPEAGLGSVDGEELAAAAEVAPEAEEVAPEAEAEPEVDPVDADDDSKPVDEPTPDESDETEDAEPEPAATEAEPAAEETVEADDPKPALDSGEPTPEEAADEASEEESDEEPAIPATDQPRRRWWRRGN